MVWRSSRSTSSAQVLVQSCGHTDGTVSTGVWAMVPSIPQRDNEPMGTPIRPLPDGIARWSARARWLRRLDALAAAGLVWALLAVMRPGVGAGAEAAGAAVITGLLGAVAPLRVRWRPVSGPVGLWVSRMLVPGDRAWYVRHEGPERVIVTARRGLRLTVAVPGRGAAEGLSVRRTRVLVLGADEPGRR